MEELEARASTKDRLYSLQHGPSLKPVLKEWTSLVNEYMACQRRPHRWNTEKTEVGLFASAIWRSGGTALEQLSARKTQGSRTGTGREDLWFHYDKKDYIVEANVAWIQDTLLRSPEKIEAAVRARLAQASVDVRSSLRHNAGTGLALVFAPCLFEHERVAGAEAFARNSIEGTMLAGGDVHAWAFPDEALGHTIPIVGQNGVEVHYIHAGTALVGSLVDVERRR